MIISSSCLFYKEDKKIFLPSIGWKREMSIYLEGVSEVISLRMFSEGIGRIWKSGWRRGCRDEAIFFYSY
jgi:hypothetical protein